MLRQIKKQLAPALSLTLNRLGVSWPVLIKKLGTDVTVKQVKELFKQPLTKAGKAQTSLDILFMPYLGCFLGNNLIQLTLGRVLQERGHRVRFLVCDTALPICETTDISNHANREQVCKAQRAQLLKLMAASGMEVVLTSDLLLNEDLEPENLSSADHWDQFVRSMLLRYFKVGELDNDNPHLSEFTKRAKKAALISQKVGEAIVKLAPDRVIMAHGTYTTRGPAREVINQSNIPLLTISRGKLAQTQKFNWKTAGDWWSIDETWSTVKDIPLSTKQEGLIDDYLLSRRSHSKDVMVYNFTGEETREQTLAKLKVPPNQKIYTLFTNVLWDAASAQREIVFDGAVDWVLETIKAFRNHPERTLIVRIHPAESVIGTKQPMEALIKKVLNNIPESVVLLPPDAPFNSWSLLKVTDVGLVHTSTVGLELALEGIPCVCVSKTHYRSKGFTVDPESKEDYFAIIKDGVKCFDRKQTKVISKRYAYVLFLQYQIPLPFYLPESHISIRSFKRTDWPEIESSKQVKLIIDCIENKSTEFIMPEKMVLEMYEGNS